MQEPAELFKPATGSFTETELQSNINLQHPGLNTSDKQRRSQRDDSEKLASVAHPCTHTTPCLRSAVRSAADDLYNIIAARRGVFAGRPLLQIPSKCFSSLQGLKPHPAPVILKGNF